MHYMLTGKAAERVRQLTAHGDIHIYLSTACRHDECGSCRKACKFCAATCVCQCHEISTDD